MATTAKPMGQILMTAKIKEEISRNRAFHKFVSDSLRKHARSGRKVFDVNPFFFGKIKIWIKTERDRSATTVMFPNEY